MISRRAFVAGIAPALALAGCSNPYVLDECCSMPIISALTYTVTDTTIVAVWTTDVPADSNLSAGGKPAIDNGVAASGTSHQCIVTGLSPNTGYSCFVTSGGTSSTPQGVTTSALQTRIPVTSAKNGAYTAGSVNNNKSDTQRTFLSNDNKVYVTQDDGNGIVLATPNAGFNTQVAALSDEVAMTGGATLLNTYGGVNNLTGTDGPGGAAMGNKSSGLFGLNGNLHMFVYRQFPPSYTTNRYCNWIKSTDHGATWNNFTAKTTFVAGGNPVGPYSPAEPVQFYDLTIGLVTPVLYAADDGTLGYNTAGNQIDGANAYVYMTYIKDADNSTLFLMRLPRIQFDAQNAAAMQYWKGPVSPGPLDFTNDLNWSGTPLSAVNIKPSFGNALFSPSGVWNQVCFVPVIKSYVMSFSLLYDGVTTNTLWAMFSAPTPAGPWNLFFTQPNTAANKRYTGFFVFHRDIATNAASSNITAKFLQAGDVGGPNYDINYSTLTMLPSSGAQMVQLFFYGFTTIENPLSNGGNFSIAPPGANPLQVVSSGVCEATVPTGATSGAYMSGAIPPGDTGGTWPADHYVEVTIGSSISGDLTLLRVRQSSGANTCYQCVLSAITAAPVAIACNIYFVVAGTATAIGASFNLTISAGDVMRFSVTGNVLTTTQNGTQVDQRTDAGSNVAGPGFPCFALIPVAAITNLKTSTFAAGANQAAAPTFVPPGGSFSSPQTVTLNGPVGSTIFYTLDGSTPTHSSSSVATGGTISVTPPKTLRAISSASNFADSPISTATFTRSGGGDLGPGYDFFYRF